MSDTPRLDSRYVVKLGDKQYSTWPGVLDRAHQEGIQSITVDLVQVPSDDNGNVAICKATVTMKTGAIFEDYGDASPRNTNSKIVPHLIRMSSCVPLRAEILTPRGWAKYEDICLGEPILGYDVTADVCRWVPLQGISVYPEPHPVLAISGRSFRATCTPEHTWAVDRGPAFRSSRRYLLRQTKDLKSCDKVIVAAEAEEGSSTITPREAAILGWLATDGCLRSTQVKQAGKIYGPYRRGLIYQSKPAFVQEIRGLLASDASESVEKRTVMRILDQEPSTVLPAYRWELKSRFLDALLDKAGMESWADLTPLVCSLTEAARAAMLDAMLKADGHAKRGGRTWVFGKKSHPGVQDALELLATLQGIAVGKPCLQPQPKGNGARPYRTLRSNRRIAVPYLTIEEAGAEPVWCPTTPLGTWVMRLDGYITITGNTRAKGRALRDAINVGECLLEELGGDDPGDRQGHYHDGGSGFKRAVERSADKWGATRAEIVNTPPVVGASLIEPPPQFLCVGCSKPMSQGQIKYCEANGLELLHPDCRAKGYAR